MLRAAQGFFAIGEGGFTRTELTGGGELWRRGPGNSAHTGVAGVLPGQSERSPNTGHREKGIGKILSLARLAKDTEAPRDLIEGEFERAFG